MCIKERVGRLPAPASRRSRILRELEKEVDAVTRAMIKAAKGGDTYAGKALLEIWAGSTQAP
ncbi:hypothetical protein LZ24_00971 [Desulfobotulus alkaliphilus]|uniref:Uncharacterized protein n=1 Tax=Desulfobotulus alkaliphilus TaxID=622671 RepID=A0A562RZH8_9BACT|nr:hypothetical protein [Desulfobotulus alkaliphilus]TWI74368.1 hypothetical protein LZ24_00971 [Desulfobotulus alkaliphilus]